MSDPALISKNFWRWRNSGKASATSSTIITGEPNEFVRQIHTRMPVILPEEHRDAWFSGAAGKEILLLRLNGVDYWIVLEVTMLIFQSSPLRISIEE